MLMRQADRVVLAKDRGSFVLFCEPGFEVFVSETDETQTRVLSMQNSVGFLYGTGDEIRSGDYVKLPLGQTARIKSIYFPC